MTTYRLLSRWYEPAVVEAYRLDRYDNLWLWCRRKNRSVVEAYRLDRYDNSSYCSMNTCLIVVEAYRLDRYDNFSGAVEGEGHVLL